MTEITEITTEATAHQFEEVDLAEGRRMLDQSARLNLGMSGDEFLAAWDDGRISNQDSMRVQQVASLIHFAR